MSLSESSGVRTLTHEFFSDPIKTPNAVVHDTILFSVLPMSQTLNWVLKIPNRLCPCLIKHWNLHILKRSPSYPSLFSSTLKTVIHCCLFGGAFHLYSCLKLKNLGKILYFSILQMKKLSQWNTVTCHNTHAAEPTFKSRCRGLQGIGLKPLDQQFLNWDLGIPSIQGSCELRWKQNSIFFY